MRSFTLLDFKRLLIETLRLQDLTPETITDDEALIGGRLGLDSIDALEIIVALEKHLGIKIRAHEIDPEAYRSVVAMHRYIETRLQAEGVAQAG